MAEAEQEEVRKCFNWRKHTLDLIKNEKWDLIEPNPCSSTICIKMMGDSPLQPLLSSITDSDKMPYIQKVIERIYGIKTPDQWFKIIIEYVPDFKKIIYFIENNLIDINNGSYHNTLFSTYANWCYTGDWKKQLNSFLSEGYNINTQNCYGENCLLNFLRNFYNYLYDERQNILYKEKILFFLENGADPLLENKRGVCSLEYVKNLKVLSKDRKKELVKLLESFS